MGQALGHLPLRELYEGLELPVPDELPGGDVGEILEIVRSVPDEVQRFVLSFVRHAPQMLAAAGLDNDRGRLPRAAEERAAYDEKESKENRS